MSSEKLSPFGNVLGFIGFFSGFYLGWKNSDGNFFVALIVACIIAFLGAAIGNLLWQVLIVALSVVVIFVQRTVTREVIVKPIFNSLTDDPPKKKTKPATATYTPRVGVFGRQIYINNTCKYPIELAVRYQDTDGNWATKAWYTIGANTNTRLLSEQLPLKTTNTTFYYFARVPGFNYSWQGEEVRSYDGQDLHMRKVQLEKNLDDDYLCTIHCGNFDEVVNSETTGRSVMLKNNCGKPVKLALAYKDIYGNWQTKGWYEVNANVNSYLLDGNSRIKASNSSLYFYASAPGTHCEWAGNEMVSFDGARLPMKKAMTETDEKGGYVFTLNCENCDERNVEATSNPIFFKNECHSPVKIVIRYENLEGQWTTLSYNNMPGNQGSFLANAYNESIKTANPNIYFYAESSDKNLEWKGDETFLHDGQELAMRKTVMKETNADRYTLTIHCSGGQ